MTLFKKSIKHFTIIQYYNYITFNDNNVANDDSDDYKYMIIVYWIYKLCVLDVIYNNNDVTRNS